MIAGRMPGYQDDTRDTRPRRGDGILGFDDPAFRFQRYSVPTRSSALNPISLLLVAATGVMAYVITRILVRIFS